MASSATRGQPRNPSLAAISPSCATAPSVNRGSSQCWARSTSKPLAYSMARRMIRGLSTHLPSSEKSRTFASECTIMPNSVSSLPARPLVMDPTGCTSHRPMAWPLYHTDSAMTGWSMTGLVFAMVNTAVNPPFAAAADPVAMVSVSSRPGSRRCTWMSTRPGRSTLFSPSITRSAVVAAVPTSVMTPSVISTLTGSPSP